MTKNPDEPMANSASNRVEISSNDQDDVHMEEEILEEEIFDFDQEMKNLLQDLLSSVMKAKVMHSLPNEGVDEILKAITEASRKSNLLLKRKLKEVLRSQNRKILKKYAYLFSCGHVVRDFESEAKTRYNF